MKFEKSENSWKNLFWNAWKNRGKKRRKGLKRSFARKRAPKIVNFSAWVSRKDLREVKNWLFWTWGSDLKWILSKKGMVPREEIFGSKKSREVKFSFREEKSREKKWKFQSRFWSLKREMSKKWAVNDFWSRKWDFEKMWKNPKKHPHFWNFSLFNYPRNRLVMSIFGGLVVFSHFLELKNSPFLTFSQKRNFEVLWRGRSIEKREKICVLGLKIVCEKWGLEKSRFPEYWGEGRWNRLFFLDFWRTRVTEGKILKGSFCRKKLKEGDEKDLFFRLFAL